MVKITTAITIMFCCIVLSKQVQQTSRIAQVLQYNYIFSETSDLSIIILACGNYQKLSLTLKSFLYFNTHKIYKTYIGLCSTQHISIQNTLPYGYYTNQAKFEIIYAQNQKSSMIDLLQTIYSKIRTKYVYQSDAQWLMVKGFGFIDQAMNILKQEGIKQQNKILQVVSNYPYWRTVARLSPLIWSTSGQKYHKIIPFVSKNYAYFTLSPSVFEFKRIYNQISQKTIKQLCSQICAPLNQNLTAEQQQMQNDKCCIWAIGQHLYSNGYQQIYLNDGSGEPNHQYIK